MVNPIENYLLLKDEVEKINKDAKIVVVTKYLSSVDYIKELNKLGVVDFAENYAQELQKKSEELKDLEINWHFIGHLQRNKVKKVVPISFFIQSLDSVELAKKINEEALKLNKVQRCLLELKVSEEKTKFGIEPQEIHKVLQDIISFNLRNIDIEGLMVMAPYFDNPELTRPYFKKAYEIFCDIKKNFSKELKNFNILSMGMSNDYRIALEEGSNMIRIGSLLFNN